MPILPIPLEDEFILTPEGVTEDDPIVVRFTQATEGDSSEREKLLQGKWYQEYNDDENTRRVAIEGALDRLRIAADIWLTMSWCNIRVPEIKKGKIVTDSDGEPKTKPLFIFTKDKTGRSRVSTQSFKSFREKLSSLPSEWVNAMHKACLEVNPFFSPFFIKETEDEQIVRKVTATEGE